MNRKIAITLPVSWQELTDRQLYYLYDLFLDNLSADQIKTYCFFLWGKIRIECRYDEHDYIVRHDKETFKVSRELIASAIHELDWIVEIPEYPVRISRIRKHAALPADFQGVEFENTSTATTCIRAIFLRRSKNFSTRWPVSCTMRRA